MQLVVFRVPDPLVTANLPFNQGKKRIRIAIIKQKRSVQDGTKDYGGTKADAEHVGVIPVTGTKDSAAYGFYGMHCSGDCGTADGRP